MPEFPQSTETELSAFFGHLLNVKMFGALGDGIADDTDAFLKAIDDLKTSGRMFLFIPSGVYLTSSPIAFEDMSGVHLLGAGWSSVIKPKSSLLGNTIDVSGCTDMEISNLAIDGALLPYNGLNSAIHGDGTAANPTYGRIKVHHLLLKNYENQGLGIGANSGRTSEGICYEDNYFLNCIGGNAAANAIDTGSSGTKRGYTISRNRFHFITQPTVQGGNAIFCGHGYNEDFTISHNQMYDPPSTGIGIHNRPFIGEVTTLKNFQIHGNIIHRPRWSGIVLAGGTNITVNDNTVINPGLALNVDETRCGILITYQISATSPFPCKRISIQGNNIVDESATPAMKYGILESSDVGTQSEGTILPNVIVGASVADISVQENSGQTNWSILYGSNGKWSVGEKIDTARWNVSGDARFQLPGNNVFQQVSVQSAVVGGNFFNAYGFNVRFDGTNWISGADTVNNAFALIVHEIGAGTLRFYTKASSGGTPQTITPLQLASFLRLTIDSVGSALWESPAGLRLNGKLAFNKAVDPTYEFDLLGDVRITTLLEMFRVVGNMRIDGNLGLSCDPTAKLDVNGASRFREGCTFDGLVNRPAKFLFNGQLIADKINLENTDDVTGQLSASRVGDGSVNDTEFLFLNGVTSHIQDQFVSHQAQLNDRFTKGEVLALLDGKSNLGHSHAVSTQGAHTHGGQIVSDGNHTHSLTPLP